MFCPNILKSPYIFCPNSSTEKWQISIFVRNSWGQNFILPTVYDILYETPRLVRAPLSNTISVATQGTRWTFGEVHVVYSCELYESLFWHVLIGTTSIRNIYLVQIKWLITNFGRVFVWNMELKHSSQMLPHKQLYLLESRLCQAHDLALA